MLVKYMNKRIKNCWNRTFKKINREIKKTVHLKECQVNSLFITNQSTI